MPLCLRPDDLKLIVQQMSIDELTDESRVDLFSIACENDEYIETTKMIIKKGKDVNKHFRRATPYLHLAITHVCLNTCQLLIESGIYIDLEFRGKTPLQTAMMDIEAFRIACLLIFHGCNIDITLKTKQGYCNIVTYVLPEARDSKYAVIMKFLLERTDVYLPQKVRRMPIVEYALDRVEQYSIAMGLVQRGAKLRKGVYGDDVFGLFPKKNAFSMWYRLVYVKIAIMSVKVNNPSVPISLLDKDTRRKLCSFLC